MKKFIYGLFLLAMSVVSFADENFVAKVNNAAITSRELEAEINKLIPESTFHGNISDEKRVEFREKALERLINRELKFQDAQAQGIKLNEKFVKEAMRNIRDMYKTKKEYKNALEQAGVKEDYLQSLVEKDILIHQVTEKMVAIPAQMDEAAVRAYYDKNIDKFVLPESVKLRIISAKDAKKAKTAQERVAGGEDFGTVAASMSENNYRIMGGDIGFVHRGRLLPEIEDAAFRLSVGEVSGLVKAQDIWYLLKVEDKQPKHKQTFEEAKVTLKKELEKNRAEELMKTWLSDLRSHAKIEILTKTPVEATQNETR